MDFTLTEDQQAIFETARAFAQSELAPHSAHWDEEKIFPVDTLRAAAGLGLAGIYVRRTWAVRRSGGSRRRWCSRR